MNTKHVLLGILIAAVFATGFLVGRFSSVGNSWMSKVLTPVGTMKDDSSDTQTAEENTTPAIVSGMSDAQKSMLSAIGIDVNNITPEMITCAETGLGAERTEEVKNGSAITFTEKVKLLACYSQ